MTCLFLILHVSALVVQPLALFVTIPLHIIASVIANKKDS